jgi:CDP-diacylglycerol---serine O-phosphatidyltransferase
MRTFFRPKVPFWQEDRSWIPCTVTMCNALFGLSAILYIINLPDDATTFQLAPILMLLAAAICDSLDGFVARKLHAESIHGMNLDSFADMISFGLAPAIITFHMARGMVDIIPYGNWILWVGAGFYAACTMWRLAQYNTMSMSGSEDKGLFTGLPSPAAAITLCAVALALHRLGADDRTSAIAMISYAFIVGFLMVSGFVYMHGKKILCTGPLYLRITLALLSIFALIRFETLALLALIHLYLLSAPVTEVVLRHNTEDHELTRL